jgi:hypothetical protein
MSGMRKDTTTSSLLIVCGLFLLGDLHTHFSSCNHIRYYDFDDDFLRGMEVAYNSTDMFDANKRCRRVSDHQLNLPACNNIHELPWVEYNVTYLR